MKPTPAAVLRGLAIGALFIAWAVCAHYGSAGEANADFSATVATSPFVVLAILLLWRSGNPLRIIGGSVAMLGLLAWFWSSLRQNIALLYYLQHIGTNLALGVFFGRTLFGGREPLVTQFARLAHGGAISEIKRRYSQQVTIAWTAFFFTMVAVSTALFWLAPASAWSVFANLLSTPLIMLMFVGEHLARFVVLPPDERSSVADSIRGYRASMQERRAHSLANHP